MKAKGLLSIALIGGMMFHLFGQAGTRVKSPYEKYENLLALVEGKDKTEYILIDVRTKEEYEEGHIPGALLIPYDEIGPKKPDYPKDKLVIVYCRSGRRSAIAAEALEDLGFKEVVDFGGVGNWKGRLVKGPKPR